MSNSKSKHKRREKYWKIYHRAHSKELAFLIAVIVELVTNCPCPRPQATRGRPPKHSKAKLDFVCILMIAINISLRDMESLLAVLKTPWGAEPVPDHSTMGNHLDTIDEDWLQLILTKTAQMCMETAGWTSGSTASDSSGVEMDRYETVEKDGLEKRRKKYDKYHVTAILGLQIVLDSRITPSDTHDTKVLGPMMETIKEQELDIGPSTHSCDTAYDAEKNFKLLFEHKLNPNIRQRPPGKNPEKSKHDTPNRAKGAEMFDPVEYAKRDMIEGIFGAEEAKNHQLHCRFIKEGNMRRFGKIRGIGWNIKVLNRLRCSKELGIPIPLYPNRRTSTVISKIN